MTDRLDQINMLIWSGIGAADVSVEETKIREEQDQPA